MQNWEQCNQFNRNDSVFTEYYSDERHERLTPDAICDGKWYFIHAGVSDTSDLVGVPLE
jgi:hypothetical protein